MRTPEHKCPRCSKVVDALTAAIDPEAVPEDGAMTCCAYCGYLEEFKMTDDGVLVRQPFDLNRCIDFIVNGQVDYVDLQQLINLSVHLTGSYIEKQRIAGVADALHG